MSERVRGSGWSMIAYCDLYCGWESPCFGATREQALEDGFRRIRVHMAEEHPETPNERRTDGPNATAPVPADRRIGSGRDHRGRVLRRLPHLPVETRLIDRHGIFYFDEDEVPSRR